MLYPRPGTASTTPRRSRTARPWLRKLPQIAYLTAMGVFLLAPIVVIMAASVTSTSFVTFPPEGFSLRWYTTLGEYPDFLRAMLLSTIVAGGSAVAATVLGVIAALALHNYNIPGRDGIQILLTSPILLPPIVLGVGLLQWLSFTGIAGSPLALILAHVVLGVPFVLRLVTASVMTLDPNLGRVAASLGASPLRAFWRVTLPLLRTGIAAGAIFAFIISFDDVTVAIFLVTSDLVTMPVKIYTYMHYQYDPIITSVSTIMVLFAGILVVATDRLVGLSRGFGMSR